MSFAYDLLLKKTGSLKFESLSELESIKVMRNQVLNFLKFILVTAKNEDDAYTIFETLNARGLSLTSVDLIKNWIFKNYSQIHPNDNAKDVWREIRKRISDFSDLETFFRHYWNSKYAFASNDRLYKSFKLFLKAGIILSARDFLLELKTASEYYRKIGSPEDGDWTIQKEKVIGQSLVLINQYKVTQVRPLLLALFECKPNINQTIFIKSIVNLENFHFLFSNLCQDRASGLEGKYTRAAKNLRMAGDDKQKVRKVLVDLNKYLEKKRPNLQRVTDSLNKLDFKNGNDLNKKTIQTIFSKIEKSFYKTNEFAIGSFSLEHIKDQSESDLWIGSIGNIIPLDENINNMIKGGITFKDKKNKYSKSRFETVKYFLNLNHQDTWTEENAKKWVEELGRKLFAATDIQKL